MNLLDDLIAAVLPERAVRRVQARMALDAIRRYEAAELGRRTHGWRAGSGTASVEALGSIETLRNRSSQMVRDNEYAKKAIVTLATKIVGTGITVIPDSRSERKLWQQWSEEDCDAGGELDRAGLEALAVKTWKERGECLVRRRWRKPEDGLSVPMQIQLLEPDHLDETRTGYADNGNVVIMGVEFDVLGRRAAYWLFPEHPGETTIVRRSLQSKRVPASEVIHLYRKDRISQVRGIPELTVSLMRLRDLKGYEEAELVRKKIEACFTAFVTTANPRQSLGDLQKASDQRTIEKLSPGLIKYLAQDESVTFGTPTAVGGYGEYTGTQLHAIAVGCGITYHQLTGDTSRSSYTSHRAALREFYDLVDAEQWLTFIPMFVRPIRRWWREAAELAGVPLGTKPDRITTPRKQVVDPLKDTMADKEDIRGGLSTLFEKLRERGIDPEDWIEEKQAELKQLAEAGIVLDIDAAVSELKLKPADVLGMDGKANGEAP
ncbi:MAG TPA: phage portal protein [Burkholderiaceae bacterium]|nr:phage portal protein [Burkholderiaceae bacterium]